MINHFTELLFQPFGKLLIGFSHLNRKQMNLLLSIPFVSIALQINDEIRMFHFGIEQMVISIKRKVL